MRVMGNASFATVRDSSGDIQIYVSKNTIDVDLYEDFKTWDLGDIIGVKGKLFKTKTDELTIEANEVNLITKEGITKIEKSDFHYAMDMGYTVKHLAVAKLDNGMVELRAHPALINLKSHLANLKGVRNGMEIDTDLIGKIHIAGSGAGQESTASGLISDLVHLCSSVDLNTSEKQLNKISPSKQ